MKTVAIIIIFCLLAVSLYANEEIDTKDSKFEWLVFPVYDSDIGFGLGAKGFYLNPLGYNESFDALVFASTKGERWFRFVFSFPDFELRQGKVYDWAFDFIIDYDLMINNSFFGVGNDSKFEDREYYSREPLDISLTASRGFTKEIVAQTGVRMRVIRNYNFTEESNLNKLSPELNEGRSQAFSFFITGRYDTRDSYVNAQKGFVVQAETEYTPDFNINNVHFLKWAADLQYYHLFKNLNTVLACRFRTENVNGDSLPVQLLLPIGGNRTLRGATQDRYLDKLISVLNLECRFPIIDIFGYNLGGIFGVDAGKAWKGISYADIKDWRIAPVVGLRYYFYTYVARIDIGFGNETTGIYFNFGHMF